MREYFVHVVIFDYVQNHVHQKLDKKEIHYFFKAYNLCKTNISKFIFNSSNYFQTSSDLTFCSFFEHSNICSGVCFEINLLHNGQICSFASVGSGFDIIMYLLCFYYLTFLYFIDILNQIAISKVHFVKTLKR